MKKALIYIAFILLSSTAALNAQVLINLHKGTWQYQNGNQVFVVSIWDEVQEGQTVVLGHYKMITVDSNGNQTGTIYNSRKYWGTSTTYYPYAIYMGTYDGMDEGGIIKDNTVNTPRGFIQGSLRMTIQPNSSPSTAHWTVGEEPDAFDLGEPDFNIPTDIILTKVSNTINLD